MSFRPWSVIVAIGLAVAFLSVSGQAQQQTGGTYWQTQAEQYPSSKPPPTVRVDIIEDQSTVEARKRLEEEARQREIDDLLAQQGMNAATQAMNEATQKMVGLSRRQTWLVGIGTALLFVTLGLTWQANRAASDAVKVTKEVGQAQLRAYLTTFDVMIKNCEPGQIPEAFLSIKNSGQTPAKIVSFNQWLHIGDFPLVGELPQPNPGQTKSIPIVGPGLFAKVKINRHIDLHEEQFRQMEAGTMAIYFYGAVEYIDIFGDKHSLYFAFKHGGDIGVGHEEMASMNTHNDATYFEQSNYHSVPSRAWCA